MNNTFYAFLLTVLAGLSTMLGTIFIFIKKKDTNKIVLSSLSFAAGVMICVSITDLIPESINLLRDNINNISTIIIYFLGIPKNSKTSTSGTVSGSVLQDYSAPGLQVPPLEYNPCSY